MGNAAKQGSMILKKKLQKVPNAVIGWMQSIPSFLFPYHVGRNVFMQFSFIVSLQ